MFFFLQKRGFLKPLVGEVVNGFTLGMADIAGFNFLSSTIPKVQDVDCITQFRPIALINMLFKLVMKVYALRLCSVAQHIVDLCQSFFIGRCFLSTRKLLGPKYRGLWQAKKNLK